MFTRRWLTELFNGFAEQLSAVTLAERQLFRQEIDAVRTAASRERDDRLGFVVQLEKQLAEAKTAHAMIAAKLSVVETQLAIAQNNFEWARIRLNQIEDERSRLFERVIAVTAPFPILHRTDASQVQAPVAPPPPPGQVPAYGVPAEFSFEDVGDSEAAALGLQHDAFGNVEK